MTTCKRILITPGEPAGIGPDITLMLAQTAHDHELVVVADPKLLTDRAKLHNLPLQLIDADFSIPAQSQSAGTLRILPVTLEVPVTPGQLDTRNAAYVIDTLQQATNICLTHKAHGIVTGPVHKSVINNAGIAFSGHTEFFAKACQVPLSVMLFVVDNLKIALATTHLPLKDVPKAITSERLYDTIKIMAIALRDQFGITTPNISICGLNPHAGENGHLGREEIEVMTPTLDRLRKEGLHIDGPFAADTMFTPKRLAATDAVLAMYHDQALPLVKYLGFHHSVNVTLGLPFIRTSVDHGTALDVAGTTKVNHSGLAQATELCTKLSAPPP